MTFDWYKIFNLTEFEALDLVSKAYILNLEGLGEQTVMVFKGNEVSIQYDDVTLPIQLHDENPFVFDGYAVYIDENDDVFLGVEIES